MYQQPGLQEGEKKSTQIFSSEQARVQPGSAQERDDRIPSRESTEKLTPGSLSFTKGTDPSSSPFLASRMFFAHTLPCTRFLSSCENEGPRNLGEAPTGASEEGQVYGLPQKIKKQDSWLSMTCVTSLPHYPFAQS